MIPLNKINDEIYVASDPIVNFGLQEIDFVKTKALESPRKRARICAHKDNSDGLHEMLIAISSDSYIHPHKHLNKSESFHVVEGEVDVVIFDDSGAITDVVELGPVGSGRNFYYRLSDSKFHTLRIRSDILVIHEVTNGPFIKQETEVASFAPTEGSKDEEVQFMNNISDQVDQFLDEEK